MNFKSVLIDLIGHLGETLDILSGFLSYFLANMLANNSLFTHAVLLLAPVWPPATLKKIYFLHQLVANFVFPLFGSVLVAYSGLTKLFFFLS